MRTTDPCLLLLHPDDMILVARRRIRAGEAVIVEVEDIVLAADLPVGRKLARRAALAQPPTVPMGVSELVIGTVCGGSDGTSGPRRPGPRP